MISGRCEFATLPTGSVLLEFAEFDEWILHETWRTLPLSLNLVFRAATLPLEEDPIRLRLEDERTKAGARQCCNATLSAISSQWSHSVNDQAGNPQVLLAFGRDALCGEPPTVLSRGLETLDQLVSTGAPGACFLRHEGAPNASEGYRTTFEAVLSEDVFDRLVSSGELPIAPGGELRETKVTRLATYRVVDRYVRFYRSICV
jgi:hypothetical protein